MDKNVLGFTDEDELIEISSAEIDAAGGSISVATLDAGINMHNVTSTICPTVGCTYVY